MPPRQKPKPTENKAMPGPAEDKGGVPASDVGAAAVPTPDPTPDTEPAPPVARNGFYRAPAQES